MFEPNSMMLFDVLREYLEENPKVLENPASVKMVCAQINGFFDGSLIGTGGYGARMRAGKAKKDVTGPT